MIETKCPFCREEALTEKDGLLRCTYCGAGMSLLDFYEKSSANQKPLMWKVVEEDLKREG